MLLKSAFSFILLAPLTVVCEGGLNDRVALLHDALENEKAAGTTSTFLRGRGDRQLSDDDDCRYRVKLESLSSPSSSEVNVKLTVDGLSYESSISVSTNSYKNEYSEYITAPCDGEWDSLKIEQKTDGQDVQVRHVHLEKENSSIFDDGCFATIDTIEQEVTSCASLSFGLDLTGSSECGSFPHYGVIKLSNLEDAVTWYPSGSESCTRACSYQVNLRSVSSSSLSSSSSEVNVKLTIDGLNYESSITVSTDYGDQYSGTITAPCGGVEWDSLEIEQKTDGQDVQVRHVHLYRDGASIFNDGCFALSGTTCSSFDRTLEHECGDDSTGGIKLSYLGDTLTWDPSGSESCTRAN